MYDYYSKAGARTVFFFLLFPLLAKMGEKGGSSPAVPPAQRIGKQL